jgi:hypothetical protein
MSRIAPYGGNLDGLIDEGMSQVQGCRLKGEALTAAAGFGPIGWLILVGHEHDDAGRTQRLAR